MAAASEITPGSIDSYPGWIVGAGYVAAPEPFVGNPDDASQLFPIVGYLGERLTWLGPSIEYRFWSDDLFSVSAAAEVNFQGFDQELADANQTPILSGLSKRQAALEAGFDVDAGPLSLSVRTDVSDKHGGHSAALTASQDWDISDRFAVGIAAGVDWQSKDLVRYYYGIADNEVTADRAAYRPGNALSPKAELMATWQANDRTLLILALDHRWLDKEIRNSPIISDSSETSLFAGVIFQLFR